MARRPGPWKKLFKAIDGMARRKASEDIGEVGFGIDIAEFDGVDGLCSRHESINRSPDATILNGRPFMTRISTVGLDIGKRVLQVHCADASGQAVLQRKLRREEVITFFHALPACQVGMEACATSHYWARQIRTFGYEVRLIPPSYVKPYASEE